VSGEHGDGRARSELLGRMYGADGLRLLTEMKDIWDPGRVMNPGVMRRCAAFDAGIRHMGAAKDRKPLTLFAYPDDNHDFAQAQRRCVGIGKCRQSSGGVMCPSYQATHEEMHSTRGRAHLLWEMLEGDLVTDGWRSTEVRDALDLCLSCKGCLSDCPVNVDMATYKAEFTHHHYAGRPWARPASHWSMGWLPLWSRFASRAPRLVNRMARMPVAKRMGGIAPEREIPVFAERTFTSWFAGRAGTGPAARGTVVLWPDTFTNHLSPEVGRAAVEVLEAAGYEVVLPTGPVCCGLTWISTGQLRVAKRRIKRSLARLAPHLAAGTPIVGLEPSCLAVLRRDAPELLPDDALAAAAAASTFTFAEFLTRSVGNRRRFPPTRSCRPTATNTPCSLRRDPQCRRRASTPSSPIPMLRLRHFRLRKGSLRRVSRRGNGFAARGPRRRFRHRHRRRRLQLPDTDPPRHPAAGGAPGPAARQRDASGRRVDPAAVAWSARRRARQSPAPRSPPTRRDGGPALLTEPGPSTTTGTPRSRATNPPSQAAVQPRGGRPGPPASASAVSTVEARVESAGVWKTGISMGIVTSTVSLRSSSRRLANRSRMSANTVAVDSPGSNRRSAITTHSAGTMEPLVPPLICPTLHVAGPSSGCGRCASSRCMRSISATIAAPWRSHRRWDCLRDKRFRGFRPAGRRRRVHRRRSAGRWALR
jgi:Fe-S oxidoreductase